MHRYDRNVKSARPARCQCARAIKEDLVIKNTRKKNYFKENYFICVLHSYKVIVHVFLELSVTNITVMFANKVVRLGVVSYLVLDMTFSSQNNSFSLIS